MIKEIQAKTILRKYKKIDSWFISRYGFNLYRGCSHNCVYCDGRNEKYNVENNFGKDVIVKINAIDILRRELDPRRKRKPMSKCFIMCGGGVGDSYQPVEKDYKLTKKVLELLYEYNLPISILTKSTLVKRDIEIIKKINEKSKAIVSFSFSSVDEKISSIFEPGVPIPDERLETIKFFRKEKVSCGMFLLPVIPFITDKTDLLEESIIHAKQAGVDFIIFGCMTLKEGKQREYFLNKIKDYDINLIKKYKEIYKNDRWGTPISNYYESLNKKIFKLAKKHNVPVRIPSYIFKDILDENSLVIVILEHLDYLLKLQGRSSPYSYSAYAISKLNEPISNMKGNLRDIKGVGKTTEKIILDILKNKTSSYYENLLFN